MIEFLIIVNLCLFFHFYINYRLERYVKVNKNERALIYDGTKNQNGRFAISTIYFHGAVDDEGNTPKIQVITFIEDKKLMYSDFDKLNK